MLTKMGDVEQLVAEPDELEGGEEDVGGLHPHTLNQQNPWVITQVFTSVVTLIASNGWYALGLLIVAYLIWIKIQPKVASWLKKRENDREAAAYHKDPDKFLAKERAIDAARQRMQERYNQSAASWAEKQKEKEEKRRQERIEGWERNNVEAGQRIGSRPNATAAPTAPAATASGSTSNNKKKSGKAKLKPEYNPMAGDVGGGGSCRWRPDRRGPSGGG